MVCTTHDFVDAVQLHHAVMSRVFEIECELVQHGFNDIVEYPTIRHYTESLPLLYKKENLVLY